MMKCRSVSPIEQLFFPNTHKTTSLRFNITSSLVSVFILYQGKLNYPLKESSQIDSTKGT